TRRNFCRPVPRQGWGMTQRRPEGGLTCPPPAGAGDLVRPQRRGGARSGGPRQTASGGARRLGGAVGRRGRYARPGPEATTGSEDGGPAITTVRQRSEPRRTTRRSRRLGRLHRERPQDGPGQFLGDQFGGPFGAPLARRQRIGVVGACGREVL